MIETALTRRKRPPKPLYGARLRQSTKCKVWGSVAAQFDRLVALVADDEDACGSFDDVVGDGFELVDLEYPGDLREEPLKKSEVPTRDSFDGGDGLSVREVLRIEGASDPFLVEGHTLSDPSALTNRPEAERADQASRLFRSTLIQIIDDGVFHADLHPGNIMLAAGGELVLLDFGSIGRLDSELRKQIGNVLLAFYRGDSRNFADALLAFVELPDDIDEFQLRREIGAFMSNKLGPGSAIDVTVFTEMVRLLSSNRIAVPGGLASAFRAIATLEGTLRYLSPSFQMLTEAADFAERRVAEATRPAALYATATDELASILPLLRRLPERADRISGALASGRLSMNVRLLADHRDRSLIRDLVNLLAVTFLAGVFGVMAAMLLISNGGPEVSPSLTLYQIFGYLLVVASGLLTLKVLFDVFRLRGRP